MQREARPTKKGGPRYRQIADHLRMRIGTEYQVAQVLPTERALAVSYDANHQTVRQALAVLAEEGLIARYPRRGSVVVDRWATGEFAIVVKPRFLRPVASPYFPLVATSIAEALLTRNSRWVATLHVGRVCDDDGEHVASLDLWEPDVLKRLRGVFTFHPLGKLEAQLKTARIPLVNLWAAQAAVPPQPENNTVAPDYLSLYENAFAHLQKVGCRNVGILAFLNKEHSARALAALTRSAKAHRVRLNPEWLRENMHWGGQREAIEPMAHDMFCRLWRTASHPDALLVTDDVLCRGVLRASLRLGIEFPDQLRLISHANLGAPFAYHKPITRVEFDPAAQAEAAVDLMTRLQRNPEAAEPPIRIPAIFIQGATT
ncbi:MAG: substrate-binding domain-containing protein [Kiritimatiellae bacterium]|nr:substrate-binding domain-containing protein [Kiritimatiellia bacterium]